MASNTSLKEFFRTQLLDALKSCSASSCANLRFLSPPSCEETDNTDCYYNTYDCPNCFLAHLYLYLFCLILRGDQAFALFIYYLNIFVPINFLYFEFAIEFPIAVPIPNNKTAININHTNLGNSIYSLQLFSI